MRGGKRGKVKWEDGFHNSSNWSWGERCPARRMPISVLAHELSSHQPRTELCNPVLMSQACQTSTWSYSKACRPIEKQGLGRGNKFRGGLPGHACQLSRGLWSWATPGLLRRSGSQAPAQDIVTAHSEDTGKPDTSARQDFRFLATFMRPYAFLQVVPVSGPGAAKARQHTSGLAPRSTVQWLPFFYSNTSSTHIPTAFERKSG